MSRFPNIERRDSGPASQDRTSDEWFEPELTDKQVEAQDSLFGIELASYGTTGVSVRRNLPYLTSTERLMLDSSDVERQAREARDRIAKSMGARLPGATA